MDGNTLSAVIISTLPAAGTLKLSGVAVTAGQSIPVASIGNLVYAPAANANGTGYASFGFTVQDNGGMANGGMDTSVTANILTIDVTPINDAPIITVNQPTAHAVVNTPYNLTGMFSISDVDVGDGVMTASLNPNANISDLNQFVVNVGDSGVTIIAGPQSGFVYLSGTLSQLNALLSGSGTASMTLTISDGSLPQSTTMRLYANDNSNTAPQALSTVEIATVNINHAPVIESSSIWFVNDDPSSAMLVSTLTSYITDVDANSLKGVAITGVNYGKLYYIDAEGLGEWVELTNLSSTHAFLLNDAASMYLRFVPNNDLTGTIADAIKFRAWDQTGGDVKETYVDISTTGGITAFSSQESSVSFDPSLFIPPIVLDLNQDGILNYSQSIMDVNEDGQLDQTAWAGKEEGVLIWDKYADGQVHDNSQYAFAQYGGKTDLSGLAAAFDTNHDGKFNAQDAKFDEFAVWQDANQNGVSDAGEVFKLFDIGMSSLNLNTDNVLRQPAAGVTEFGQTSAQLTNGSSMLIADVAFAYTTIKLDDVLQSPTSNVTPLIVNGESLDVSPFVDTHYQAPSFYDAKTAQLMDDLVNQTM